MRDEPKLIPAVNPTKEELEKLDSFFEAYNGRRKIEPLRGQERTKEFYENYEQQRTPKHHNKKVTKRKPKGKKTHRK